MVVDKPFTLDVKEAEDLQQRAEKQVNCCRFIIIVAGIQVIAPWKILQDGCLGEIKYYESHFDRFRPVVRQRWREANIPEQVFGTI